MIKIKGLLEFLFIGRSIIFVFLMVGNLEKKDYRLLMDCLYFVENCECFLKFGEVCKFIKMCV